MILQIELIYCHLKTKFAFFSIGYPLVITLHFENKSNYLSNNNSPLENTNTSATENAL